MGAIFYLFLLPFLSLLHLVLRKILAVSKEKCKGICLYCILFNLPLICLEHHKREIEELRSRMDKMDEEIVQLKGKRSLVVLFGG